MPFIVGILLWMSPVLTVLMLRVGWKTGGLFVSDHVTFIQYIGLVVLLLYTYIYVLLSWDDSSVFTTHWLYEFWNFALITEQAITPTTTSLLHYDIYNTYTPSILLSLKTKSRETMGWAGLPAGKLGLNRLIEMTVG